MRSVRVLGRFKSTRDAKVESCVSYLGQKSRFRPLFGEVKDRLCRTKDDLLTRRDVNKYEMNLEVSVKNETLLRLLNETKFNMNNVVNCEKPLDMKVKIGSLELKIGDETGGGEKGGGATAGSSSPMPGDNVKEAKGGDINYLGLLLSTLSALAFFSWQNKEELKRYFIDLSGHLEPNVPRHEEIMVGMSDMPTDKWFEPLAKRLSEELIVKSNEDQVRFVALNGENSDLKSRMVNHVLQQYKHEKLVEGKNITIGVINAYNYGTFKRDLDKISRSLGIPYVDMDQVEFSKSIMEQLQKRGDWIIVVNNLQKEYNLHDGSRESYSSLVSDIFESRKLPLDYQLLGHKSRGQVIVVPDGFSLTNLGDIPIQRIDIDSEEMYPSQDEVLSMFLALTKKKNISMEQARGICELSNWDYSLLNSIVKNINRDISFMSIESVLKINKPFENLAFGKMFDLFPAFDYGASPSTSPGSSTTPATATATAPGSSNGTSAAPTAPEVSGPSTTVGTSPTATVAASGTSIGLQNTFDTHKLIYGVIGAFGAVEFSRRQLELIEEGLVGLVTKKSETTEVCLDLAGVKKEFNNFMDKDVIIIGDRFSSKGFKLQRYIPYLRVGLPDSVESFYLSAKSPNLEKSKAERLLYSRVCFANAVSVMSKIFSRNNIDSKSKEKNTILIELAQSLIENAIKKKYVDFLVKEGTVDDVIKFVDLLDAAANYMTSTERNPILACRYLTYAGIVLDKCRDKAKLASGLDETDANSSERIGFFEKSCDGYFLSSIKRDDSQKFGDFCIIEKYSRILYAFARLYLYSKGQIVCDNLHFPTIVESENLFSESTSQFSKSNKLLKFAVDKTYFAMLDTEKEDQLKFTPEKIHEYRTKMDQIIMLRSGLPQLYEKMGDTERSEALKKLSDYKSFWNESAHQYQCDYLIAKNKYKMAKVAQESNSSRTRTNDGNIKEAFDTLIKASQFEDKSVSLLCKVILEAQEDELPLSTIKGKISKSIHLSKFLPLDKGIIYRSPDKYALVEYLCHRHSKLPSVVDQPYKVNKVKIYNTLAKIELHRCIVLTDERACDKSIFYSQSSHELQRRNLLRGEDHPSVVKVSKRLERAMSEKKLISL